MLSRLRSFVETQVYHRVFAREADLANIEATVSFTFDDFPLTALKNGGGLLEKYGVRGTFYLAPGLCGQLTEVGKIVSPREALKCIEAGHELGQHSYSHLDCIQASKQEILADIRKANQALENVRLENFSYPFGQCDIKSKICLRNQFLSCRGIQNGINREMTDMNELKSNPIYTSKDNLDELVELVTLVKNRGGWLILYTHDVCETPSPYGCTEREFETLLANIIDQGVAIKPVADVVSDLGRDIQ